MCNFQSTFASYTALRGAFRVGCNPDWQGINPFSIMILTGLYPDFNYELRVKPFFLRFAQFRASVFVDLYHAFFTRFASFTCYLLLNAFYLRCMKF